MATSFQDLVLLVTEFSDASYHGMYMGFAGLIAGHMLPSTLRMVGPN